jgi:hypothetical protein
VTGLRRLIRIACAVAILLALAACQIDINLTTTVNRDGSGSIALQFVVDRELVDLARNSGQDPLQVIEQLVSSFKQAGWTVERTTLGGGVQATAERRFSNPEELRLALRQIQQQTSGGTGVSSTFFSLSVDRSSGFFRTKTGIRGSIDLTLDRVLGASDLPEETRKTLQTLIEQTSGDFFTFTLRAKLPGKVSSTDGDPEKIDGGDVEWEPRLGRAMAFRAETSAFNAGSVGAVGVPALVIILLGGVVHRRRRAARAGSN